jgi:hypothetical protein
MAEPNPTLIGLPGAALVDKGIADLERGHVSAESLLVTVAAERLETLGVLRPGLATGSVEAPLALYALLGKNDVIDPYSTYNALLRELSSFVRALEHRIFSGQRDSGQRDS